MGVSWLKANPRLLALVALLLFGIAGVISAYTRMSMTDDEGFHINCGMQWWKTGKYDIQPLHPPLGRVADASLLYFANSIAGEGGWKKLPPRDAYIDKMILTRLGVLPFYIFSCAMVYCWSRRLYGEAPALWSLASYVSLASVTAHAGLATTDMPYTAIFLWGLWRSVEWLKLPDIKNSVWFGVALGLMVGAKYSSLAQWPAAMGMVFIVMCVSNYLRSQRVIPLIAAHFIHSLLIALPMMVLVLAFVFRFTFDPLITGIQQAISLNRNGFGVFLFEPLRGDRHSVWYFFPVVFFFKTPLTFLIAALTGGRKLLLEGRDQPTDRLYPFFAAIGIMLISMTSHINLGVRHVLPLYPLLALPAGYGLWWLYHQGHTKRKIAAVLIALQFIGFIRAYPEYIPYYNILGGEHPEHISLDSDFDWGQDVILLDEALQEQGIIELYMCTRRDVFWNATVLVKAKINACPKQPVTGWIAVGRAYMQLPNNIAWLRSYQAVQIGKSTMDLYYIPPKAP